MDSKTGFGIALALMGVFVAFLAVTGRAKALIAAISGTPAQGGGWQSDPGQAGTSAAAGGSYASASAGAAGAASSSPPSQVLSGNPTSTANVGAIATVPNDLLQAIAFNSLVGTDGVKAVPYAAPA